MKFNFDIFNNSAPISDLSLNLIYGENFLNTISEIASSISILDNIALGNKYSSVINYRRFAAKAPSFNYGDEAAPKICWNRK